MFFNNPVAFKNLNNALKHKVVYLLFVGLIFHIISFFNSVKILTEVTGLKKEGSRKPGPFAFNNKNYIRIY